MAGDHLVVRLALPFGSDLGWSRGILPLVGERLVLAEACEGR